MHTATIPNLQRFEDIALRAVTAATEDVQRRVRE